jgi:hypothetical protein
MNSASERAQLYLSTNASLNELNRKKKGCLQAKNPSRSRSHPPNLPGPLPPEQNAASPILENVIKTLHIQDKLPARISFNQTNGEHGLWQNVISATPAAASHPSPED